jgi:MFS family permease
MICLGLVVGFFTCYGTGRIEGSMSWRLPFIVLVALATAFIASVLIYLPPSPRWLRLQGRDAEAEAAWEKLGVKMEDRQNMEEDLEGAIYPSDSGFRALPLQEKQRGARFLDLFTKEVRGRTLLAVFLMGSLQLSGIDAVLYVGHAPPTRPPIRLTRNQYAPLLFRQAGLDSEEASFFASGVTGIALVVVSVPALLMADKWGRRTSTMVGGLGLTTTILLIGALYASGATSNSVARWVVIVSIYFYAVLFATTWAVSIKVYAPEIQPQHTRAKATAIAHGFNWICNWFVAFIFPIILGKSSSAAYFLFGGCCALTTVVCFFFMIETKGKGLDEIERAFKQERIQGRESAGVKLGMAIKSVFEKSGSEQAMVEERKV